MIAHNLFGFDLYYFIKGYIAYAWWSKELNIGGNNLTRINFSNITGEIKFIDNTIKKGLAGLASTLSDEEIIAVKKLTEQFFNQHYYFCTVIKVQFARLNDKHFYYSNGIMSLPYGHLSLENLRKEKKKI